MLSKNVCTALCLLIVILPPTKNLFTVAIENLFPANVRTWENAFFRISSRFHVENVEILRILWFKNTVKPR